MAFLIDSSIFILTFVYDTRVIYLNHNGFMQIHNKSEF